MQKDCFGGSKKNIETYDFQRGMFTLTWLKYVF